MNWDDLRYVLAIARAGSALRAAEQLGVNQTTVLRRLDAIEAALGIPLMERRRSGQTLTAAGLRAAEAAERVEREVQHLQDALSADQRAISGRVRLTTSESLANRLVAPSLLAFRAQHPHVLIELITSDQRLDVARGEADVALRAGSSPEGAGIVARRMPDNYWTVYASRGYAAERGLPASRAEIAGHDIVGLEGQLARLEGWRWLAQSAPGDAVKVRSNSLVTLIHNLKAGLGLGALPILFGDAEPDLVRCFDPPEDLRAELWLIVRESLKDQPHVRAVTDFLAAHIRRTMTSPRPG
jgi:DNA-binding transcriptional LysR family regulator